MSIQLTLIPFGPSHEHSQTLLGPIEPTGELREALEAIEKRHGRDVPLPFNTHLSAYNDGDDNWSSRYGDTQYSADGSRLKHVRVTHLLDLTPSGYRPPMMEDSWNAAACWAYLPHLPEGWRVALYWH